MIILSIETSCDDTCIAVVKIENQNYALYQSKSLGIGSKVKSFDILSNIVSSQIKVHQKWGGVYPTLAKREHKQKLPLLLERALGQSNLLKISNSQFSISKQNLRAKIQTLNSILEREPDLLKKISLFLKKYQKPNIDAIAITIGPGLEPCLWAGVNFAKALAYWWGLPLLAVNHIEGHIWANWLPPVRPNSKFQIPNSENIFPAICLVVSGGHTQIILMSKIGDYKIIGETRDDAAGECFDKTARILGLPYPGGPAIAKIASQWKSQIPNSKSQTNSKTTLRGVSHCAPFSKIPNSKFQINLPRPMLEQKNYEFSFSGLKTAVLYHFKNQPFKTRKSKEYLRAMAFEVQQAVIDVLIHKTLKAVKEYKAKTLILAGGVAANKELRKQFKQRIKKEIPGLNFLMPASKYCTDNAAMIGVAGYYHYLKKEIQDWQTITAKANLAISPTHN